MNLSEVGLSNFRSYEKVKFTFGPLTIVLGPNGAGKTNLLEAIYLLSVGKSFRAELESEMVRQGEHFADVRGLVGNEKLRVVLADGTTGSIRKKFEVNGVGRRMIDFAGRLRVVLFGPWDMRLIDGSPSRRRGYLDGVLSQVDREYRRSLLSYEKAIRRRNKLLIMIRGGEAGRQQLFFWDNLVIKNGDYLSQKRDEYVNFINREGDFRVEYDKSAISEARLEQYAEEEVAAGVTLVGPHRDDFGVYMQEENMAKFGSRGEQRMAILWLKMGELSYMEGKTGERPLLLLDDIFSELDHKHRQMVGGIVGRQQTIITSADEHLLPELGTTDQINLS